MQPTPEVTRADVERIVRRDFPPEHVAPALAILDDYGMHPGRDRVQLAILKLAEGSLELLRSHTESARRDYRDVLAAAEYPEYMKRIFPQEAPPEERQQTLDADWKQYRDWLTR